MLGGGETNEGGAHRGDVGEQLVPVRLAQSHKRAQLKSEETHDNDLLKASLVFIE